MWCAMSLCAKSQLSHSKSHWAFFLPPKHKNISLHLHFLGHSINTWYHTSQGRKQKSPFHSGNYSHIKIPQMYITIN